MIAAVPRTLMVCPSLVKRGLRSTVGSSILRKELKTRIRGWRTMAILLAYMILLGVIAVAYLIHEGRPATGQSSGIGNQLFQVLAIFQLFLILFITTAGAAGAISGERQNKTWDLLVVTPLSSFSIVCGKLLASVAFDALLVFASLPIFSLAFIFGTVTALDVLKVYVVLLVTVVLIGTISLLISAATRRVTASMIASNVVALSFVGLALLVGYLENWGQHRFGQVGKPLTTPLTPAAQIDPFVALASALPNGRGQSFLGGLGVIHHAFRLPLTLQVWTAYSVLGIIASLMLFILATRFTRSTPRWVRAPET